jgi:hypothetical protein
MGCFPFSTSDAVDRQLKEAENLKARDRQRINKEIEKGKLFSFNNFFLNSNHFGKSMEFEEPLV